MAPTNPNRKLKKFPEPEVLSENESTDNDLEESVAGSGELGNVLEESDLDNTPEGDSDSDEAPEAESLSGGRAAADARAGALRRHEEKLNELRKTKNKAREAFIQSSKAQNSPVSGDKEQNAESEDTDGEDEDKIGEEKLAGAPRSDRLPDSIFAAAHESVERKRSKKSLKGDVQTKRRRVHEMPAERVVNGRTLRVMTDINAPPAIPSSSSTRKAKNTVKGGSAFRKKWKKVDALRAQVRSRTGPPRNFVTTVQ